VPAWYNPRSFVFFTLCHGSSFAAPTGKFLNLSGNLVLEKFEVDLNDFETPFQIEKEKTSFVNPENYFAHRSVQTCKCCAEDQMLQDLILHTRLCMHELLPAND